MQSDVTICAGCRVQQTCYYWLRFWFCYTCLPEMARDALAEEEAVEAGLVALDAQDPDQAQQLRAALAASVTRLDQAWQRFVHIEDGRQADPIPLYDRYLQELGDHCRIRRTIRQQAQGLDLSGLALEGRTAGERNA